jgi:hypothetical protein
LYQQGSVKWLGKVWTAGIATPLARIDKKHGKTRIGSLRKTYGGRGPGFDRNAALTGH